MYISITGNRLTCVNPNFIVYSNLWTTKNTQCCDRLHNVYVIRVITLL